jgi:hypothetical protein
MARAVQHLRSNGISAPDDLLAHVAPLGWSHISLSGRLSLGAGLTG